MTSLFRPCLQSYLFSVLAAALLAAPAFADDRGAVKVTKPADAGLDEKALAEIPGRMEKFVAEKQISGAVTLIGYRGKIVHLAAVGQADIEADKKMETDSLFAIASMTKPITAAAVLILQDEGKLSIDDPVSKYIPSFKEASLKDGKPKREMTIKDCLTHTAGLGGSQQNEGTLEETAEKLAKRTLDFEPGAKWQYSPGLTVVGRVVEVASGKSFDDFLRQRIFEPLQMYDTSFNPTKDQQKRLVRLYQQNKEKTGLEIGTSWINDVSTTRTPNPSGGLFSTASDVARFYQMMLGGGELGGKRILSQDAVRQLTSIQTDDLKTGFTDGNGWGLGFCVIREPQGVTQMLSSGSYGHGGAFGTQSWADPKRQMVFVLLIQRMGLPNGDASAMRQALQEQAVKAVK